MGIFSFIETFFFLSLAVSFVLILLLVYHFKKHVSLLERKYDTIVCIINDVAKEMTMMKCGYNPNFPIVDGNEYNGLCGISMSYSTSHEVPPPNTYSCAVEEIEHDEEDDTDDDDDGDSKSEYSSGSDNDSDVEDDASDVDVDTLHKIVVSDTDEPVDFEEISVNVEHEPEIVPETKEDVQATVGDDVEDGTKKMSLSTLKQLVLSKGLTTDSSKMKKNELLQLLASNIQGRTV